MRVGVRRGCQRTRVSQWYIEATVSSKHIENFVEEAARVQRRRLGLPSEVASVFSFLCSVESSFITGEIINVSGGWYLRP